MEQVCKTFTDDLFGKCKLKPKLLETLQERRTYISSSVTATLTEQNTLHIMYFSYLLFKYSLAHLIESDI